MSTSLVRAACAALFGMLAACTTLQDKTVHNSTLYERLGGSAQIAAIVSDTIDRTAQDERTRRHFDGINMLRTKTSVATHLCSVTGGNCKYEGDDMTTAHAGMDISALEFDIMDGYLAQALDRHGVDAATKHELERLLAPMKAQIVGK